MTKFTACDMKRAAVSMTMPRRTMAQKRAKKLANTAETSILRLANNFSERATRKTRSTRITRKPRRTDKFSPVSTMETRHKSMTLRATIVASKMLNHCSLPCMLKSSNGRRTTSGPARRRRRR